MISQNAYTIFPLGDDALTIQFGNTIDEETNKLVIAFFHHVNKFPIDGMIEAIPAYSSLTILYDSFRLSQQSSSASISECMKQKVENFFSTEVAVTENLPAVIRVPVCYDQEFGIDLERMADEKNISPADVASIHCSKKYRVYMLGFLPGFAYMGSVDESIASARKLQPEKITAGSVGIAGRQTGIYPLNSPGGWQIIGRTPLKIFDPGKESPCLFQAGDQVEFFQITRDEFENYQGRHS